MLTKTWVAINTTDYSHTFKGSLNRGQIRRVCRNIYTDNVFGALAGGTDESDALIGYRTTDGPPNFWFAVKEPKLIFYNKEPMSYMPILW